MRQDLWRWPSPCTGKADRLHGSASNDVGLWKAGNAAATKGDDEAINANTDSRLVAQHAVLKAASPQCGKHAVMLLIRH